MKNKALIIIPETTAAAKLLCPQRLHPDSLYCALKLEINIFFDFLVLGGNDPFSLFVFSIAGLRQNARPLLTPVSDIIRFYALSYGK